MLNLHARLVCLPGPIEFQDHPCPGTRKGCLLSSASSGSKEKSSGKSMCDYILRQCHADWYIDSVGRSHPVHRLSFGPLWTLLIVHFRSCVPSKIDQRTCETALVICCVSQFSFFRSIASNSTDPFEGALMVDNLRNTMFDSAKMTNNKLRNTSSVKDHSIARDRDFDERPPAALETLLLLTLSGALSRDT